MWVLKLWWDYNDTVLEGRGGRGRRGGEGDIGMFIREKGKL